MFNAPWEGWAFGIAVGMNQDGLYEWQDFRDYLVAEIAKAGKTESPSTYYEQWLASLEKLVIEKGFITKEELDCRTLEYAFDQQSDDRD